MNVPTPTGATDAFNRWFATALSGVPPFPGQYDSARLRGVMWLAFEAGREFAASLPQEMPDAQARLHVQDQQAGVESNPAVADSTDSDADRSGDRAGSLGVSAASAPDPAAPASSNACPECGHDWLTPCGDRRCCKPHCFCRSCVIAEPSSRAALRSAATLPYRVEVDETGCEHCAAGKSWTIVGPDDVAIGESFGAFEDAENLCEYMSDAYQAGGRGASIVTPETLNLPKIICLCGSTKFIEQFACATWELELRGFIVLGCTLLPWWFCGVRDHFAETLGIKEQRDAHHLQKIDLADEVLVLNIGGYIGWSTNNEIAYAQTLGKPVRYVTDDAELLAKILPTEEQRATAAAEAEGRS